MSKRTLLLLIVISFPLIFYAGLKCQQELSRFDQVGNPLITTIKFENKKLKDTLYLVSKRWGLTGDHQIYALTKHKTEDQNWMPHSTTDYIWQGDNTIFYKQKNDTIKIWSMQSPDKQTDLQTKQVIQINKIDRATFDNLRVQVDTTIHIIE